MAEGLARAKDATIHVQYEVRAYYPTTAKKKGHYAQVPGRSIRVKLQRPAQLERLHETVKAAVREFVYAEGL